MPFSGRPQSSGFAHSRAIDIGEHDTVAPRSSGDLKLPSQPCTPGQQHSLRDAAYMRTIEQTSPQRSLHSHHNHSDSRRCLTDALDRLVSGSGSILTSNMSTRPSRSSLHHKKSGGLRATLHRVFGSKRRRSPIEGIPPDLVYSDPGNLMADEGLKSEEYLRRGSYKSSPSLSRSMTRSSALRSHAPDPSPRYKQYLDIPAPVSPCSKRRNTLPSLVLSDHEAQNIALPLNSHVSDIENFQQTQNTNLLDKSRSRSVEAILKDYPSVHSSTPRQDRDSTIAYWRRSALEDPIPALPHISHDNATNEVLMGGFEHSSRVQPTIKPAQSFDFGLGVDDDQVSLEDRINTLEVKLFDFEYAIAKLQGVELTKPQLQPRIPRSRSSHDLLDRYSHLSTSTDSSALRLMSFSRPRPPPGASAEHDEASMLDHGSRTETTRPATSHIITSRRSRSPATSSIRMTHAEYDALMALVHDERAARQQMELQLLNLQKEVEQMQAPIYAAINYPTPEKEVIQETPRAKTLHRTPPFQFSRNTPQIKIQSHSQSRFSIDTESEFQNDEEQDEFETPREQFTFETGSLSPRGVTVA